MKEDIKSLKDKDIRKLLKEMSKGIFRHSRNYMINIVRV